MLVKWYLKAVVGWPIGKNSWSAYHGWQDALENGANDVEYISKEPDNNELNGQCIGATALKVLDDLGRENDNYIKQSQQSATAVKNETGGRAYPSRQWKQI